MMLLLLGSKMRMMMIILVFQPHRWWWWPCHSSLFMQWADVYRRFNQIPNQHSSHLCCVSLHHPSVRPRPGLDSSSLPAPELSANKLFQRWNKMGDFMPDKPDFMFSYEGLIWYGKTSAAQFSGSKRPPPTFGGIKYFCPTRMEYFYVKNICHNIGFPGNSADTGLRKKSVQ